MGLLGFSNCCVSCYCSRITRFCGTQAHLSGLQTNPNMSQAKALAYIDSTVNFFCPRIVNALMLPGNTVGLTND